LAVKNQEGIDTRKVGAVADKAECVSCITDPPDDLRKVIMDGRLAAGKSQVVNAAVLSLLQYLLNNLHRQISSGSVAFLETVPATQIAAIG
jgi:hypothetical protein